MTKKCAENDGSSWSENTASTVYTSFAEDLDDDVLQATLPLVKEHAKESPRNVAMFRASYQATVLALYLPRCCTVILGRLASCAGSTHHGAARRATCLGPRGSIMRGIRENFADMIAFCVRESHGVDAFAGFADALTWGALKKHRPGWQNLPKK